MEVNGLKVCRKCILDARIADISFDENGICNYCHEFNELEQKNPVGEEGKKILEGYVDAIKKKGKGKKYDCIIGVSGGTDSMYTLLLAKQLGLRPLAVHFDNGWNSEIAVANIFNGIRILDIDLETYVVNWDEFKDIQLSFLKASVPEVEMPTDLAIRTVLYRVASREGLEYIIEGTNFRAEGLVPNVWGYKDGMYIKSVQKAYGKVRLKTFPNLTLEKFFYYVFIRRIKLVKILNYIEYDKAPAKEILKKELEWRDYGHHHHESIFTRFFQSYLAPVKFNMDRRLVTLSALVRRGVMNRNDALKELDNNEYLHNQLPEDKKYLAKKFEISDEEFDKILKATPKSFKDFQTYYPLIKKMQPILNFLHKRKLLTGIFQSGKFIR